MYRFGMAPTWASGTCQQHQTVCLCRSHLHYHAICGQHLSRTRAVTMSWTYSLGLKSRRSKVWKDNGMVPLLFLLIPGKKGTLPRYHDHNHVPNLPAPLRCHPRSRMQNQTPHLHTLPRLHPLRRIRMLKRRMRTNYPSLAPKTPNPFHPPQNLHLLPPTSAVSQILITVTSSAVCLSK
jgi:hypothetical protein